MEKTFKALMFLARQYEKSNKVEVRKLKETLGRNPSDTLVKELELFGQIDDGEENGKKVESLNKIAWLLINYAPKPNISSALLDWINHLLDNSSNTETLKNARDSQKQILEFASEVGEISSEERKSMIGKLEYDQPITKKDIALHYLKTNDKMISSIEKARSNKLKKIQDKPTSFNLADWVTDWPRIEEWMLTQWKASKEDDYVPVIVKEKNGKLKFNARKSKYSASLLLTIYSNKGAYLKREFEKFYTLENALKILVETFGKKMELSTLKSFRSDSKPNYTSTILALPRQI
jgi:hypothetical protein